MSRAPLLIGGGSQVARSLLLSKEVKRNPPTTQTWQNSDVTGQDACWVFRFARPQKTERDPSAKHESRAAGVRAARRGGHTTRGPSLYHAVRRAQCDRVPVSRPRPTWSVLGTVARAWRPETRRNAAQTKTPPRPPPSTQELERFCPSAFLCPVQLVARILRRLEGTGLVSSALDASFGCRHLRRGGPLLPLTVSR